MQKPNWGSWEIDGPHGEHEPWLRVFWKRNPEWNYKSCQQTRAQEVEKEDPHFWVHSVNPEKAKQLQDLLNSIEVDYMDAWGDGG
jgi:hypothetical protein